LQLFYSDIKNLVLWTGSQVIGFAVNKCHGVLEYWNVGVLGLRNEIYFSKDGAEQEIKSDHHPLLIRYIHYSILPSFHYSMGYLTANTTPLG
jgi:hypothetical protein